MTQLKKYALDQGMGDFKARHHTAPPHTTAHRRAPPIPRLPLTAPHHSKQTNHNKPPAKRTTNKTQTIKKNNNHQQPLKAATNLQQALVNMDENYVTRRESSVLVYETANDVDWDAQLDLYQGGPDDEEEKKEEKKQP
jgi:hypothetical protein